VIRKKQFSLGLRKLSEGTFFCGVAVTEDNSEDIALFTKQEQNRLLF